MSQVKLLEASKFLMKKSCPYCVYISVTRSEGSVFPDYSEVATAVTVLHRRYSVGIFSYSGLSVIFGPDRKQDTMQFQYNDMFWIQRNGLL